MSRWSPIPWLLALGAATAHAAPAFSSFRFDGHCIDCAQAASTPGYAVSATLVLQDWQPGQPAEAHQFVSFRYDGSNLLAPFAVTLAGGGGDLVFDPLDQDHSFHADFRAGLPGFADVDLAVIDGDAFAFFNTALDGSWTAFRTDITIGDDFGDAGTWRSVPLPGTLALAALPLVALLRRGRSPLLRTPVAPG